MKRLAVYLAFGLILLADPARASTAPPEPFFVPPSYIDLKYKAPADLEFVYGPKTQFNLILRQYEIAAQVAEGAADANARAASEQEDHDAYARYQEGAERFGVGAYDEALKIFTELRYRPATFKQKLRSWFKIPASPNVGYSWVGEASSYMIARCQLLMAQQNWDGYNDPVTGAPRDAEGDAGSGVDQKMLKAADASYLLYLKEYPQGLYANSARNIRRKIFFLSGNQPALDQDLRRAMTLAFPAASGKPYRTTESDIVSEFEHYFHGEVDIGHDSPLLLAFAWLGNQKPKSTDIAVLEAREKDFATYPGLFRYVRALCLYRLGRYQELVDKTPAGAVTNTVLSLSTELLRAYAFAHLGKTDNALEALSNMYKAAPQDVIELNMVGLKLEQRAGLWLYSSNSPVRTEKLLRGVAHFALSDAELVKGIADTKAPADKHQFLVDELARRYVLTRNFKPLSALLDANPAGIFGTLKPAAAMLARNPDDPQGLVDIGAFVYEHYITPDGTFGGYTENHETVGALSELQPYCPACVDFKARTRKYVPPIVFFRSAIEMVHRSGLKSEAEAKALHYIVRCERNGGEYEDRCKWQETWGENNASKAAFMRLYKLYKNSEWTKRTHYYY